MHHVEMTDVTYGYVEVVVTYPEDHWTLVCFLHHFVDVLGHPYDSWSVVDYYSVVAVAPVVSWHDPPMMKRKMTTMNPTVSSCVDYQVAVFGKPVMLFPANEAHPQHQTVYFYQWHFDQIYDFYP